MPRIARQAVPDVDPREAPRYPLVEVAAYLRLPEATLKSWVIGRKFPRRKGGTGTSRPVILRPHSGDFRLSFTNLFEAYVLRALRSKYQIRLAEVRMAIDHVERQYGIERLLIHSGLRAGPGKMFLDRYGELVDLTARGQTGIREVWEAYLSRLAWDDDGNPLRFYPLTRESPDGPRVVVIDPRISFGQPIIERRAIKTATIASRFLAGEAIPEIAADYDLEVGDVEEALRHENYSRRAA